MFSGVLKPVMIADPATPALEPRTEGVSFWQVAGRAFSRRWLNLIACGHIACIALLAVFVPFIANGHPYTIVYPTKAGHVRHWPLFATLSALDLCLLVIFAGAVAFAFFYRRFGRTIVDREDRSAARCETLFIIMGIVMLISGALFYFHGSPLNPNDYRSYEAMIKEGRASGALFPPVHWSSSEQEPLIANRTFEFPSADHWLGTDGIGRDALSRLLWSTRVVMGIGFVAEAIVLIIGITIGAMMGYFASKVDLLGMRLVEIFEAVPTFILILIFVATYGRNIFMIMVILGLTGWTGVARFTRAEFLKLRKLDYVHAAIATGLPLRRLLFRHMLPNALTPIIVTATFGIAGAIMSESGLSFLGVGVEPPTPSWGALLNEAGNPAETFRWWLAIAPGFMIFLTVFSYNIIGEGLRDAIDPRTNRVR